MANMGCFHVFVVLEAHYFGLVLSWSVASMHMNCHLGSTQPHTPMPMHACNMHVCPCPSSKAPWLVTMHVTSLRFLPPYPPFCTWSPPPFHICFLYPLSHVWFGRKSLTCGHLNLSECFFNFLGKIVGQRPHNHHHCVFRSMWMVLTPTSGYHSDLNFGWTSMNLILVEVNFSWCSYIWPSCSH